MSRPRAFIELFAGTASVSLRLLGIRQPPCGYMGSKRRLAGDILAAMGLHTGQRADAILLCDAGPWGQVWDVLTRPGGPAAVAEVLRSWADEPAPELWKRMAEAPPPHGHPERRAATYLALQQGSASGRAVGEVDGRWVTHGYGWLSDTARRKGFTERLRTDCVAERVSACAEAGRWPADVRVARRHPEPADVAAWLGSEDLEGVVVYLDPPYVGCTPYAVDCPRDEVVRLSRAYADAGALVVVSEAEALPELGDWHAVDLTRSGRRNGKPEWLTMSHPPAKVPAMQGLLGLEAVPA